MATVKEVGKEFREVEATTTLQLQSIHIRLPNIGSAPFFTNVRVEVTYFFSSILSVWQGMPHQ